VESLYLLIPVALVFCVVAIRLLLWAIDNGQYDDLDKEGSRILMDEKPRHVSTPGDSTPGDSTPGDSTPGDSTPGESTPGESTPGDSTPGNSTPAKRSHRRAEH